MESNWYSPVWFRPWGWIYRPVAAIGWLLVLLTAVFCGKVFVMIDHLSHSASDTFYGVFPYIVPSLMLLNWVASKTCGSAEDR